MVIFLLSKPQYGWCDLSIGDWQDRASYLTNPHIDLLDAFINLFKNRKSSVVECDAEGWTYIIVLDFFVVHIIEDKDDFEYYSFDIDCKDLAKELIIDIEENIDYWSKWDYCDDTKEDYQRTKKKLRYKIKELKKYLENS